MGDADRRPWAEVRGATPRAGHAAHRWTGVYRHAAAAAGRLATAHQGRVPPDGGDDNVEGTRREDQTGIRHPRPRAPELGRQAHCRIVRRRWRPCQRLENVWWRTGISAL